MEDAKNDTESNTTIPNNEENSISQELDEETQAKLRGDSIGDTVFSQTFVIKTLLQFSELNWSDEEIESDLCFLWDMTVEKDVCNFLFDLNYPSLACSAVTIYKEQNRFVEIAIGILANILCVNDEKLVNEDEINTILIHLDSDDPLVLVQVVRFMMAITYNADSANFMREDILYKINYILSNSLHEELLLKTLDLMTKLTSDFKLDTKFVSSDIVNSVLKAYETLMECENDEFDLDTKEKQLSAKYLIENVNNICSYINKYENNDLTEGVKQLSNRFINEILRILNYFSLPENIFPITDEFNFYVSALMYIFRTLNQCYLSDLFLMFCKLLYLLRNDVTLDTFSSCLEIVCYFIFVGKPNSIVADLKSIPKEKAKIVVQIIKDKNVDYDFKYKENLTCIVEKFRLHICK